MAKTGGSRWRAYDRSMHIVAGLLVLVAVGIGVAMYGAYQSRAAERRALEAQTFLQRLQANPDEAWNRLHDSVRARIGRERLREVRDQTPAIREMTSFTAQDGKGGREEAWVKGTLGTRRGEKHEVYLEIAPGREAAGVRELRVDGRSVLQ